MKVILTQDVEGLGALGDVVNVKPGYGRNFLVPRKMAMIFSPQNLKVIADKKQKREIVSKKEKEEALAVAEKLSGASCTIAVKVVEEDRLFGSVTAEMVQKALEAEGINIDKKIIQIDEPIKKLGVYQIPIKLHKDVVTNCKVWVVKE